MSNVKEKVLAILNQELEMEIRCYVRQKEAILKARNPIKKFKLKKGLYMFESHIAALKFAILRIDKEIDEKP